MMNKAKLKLLIGEKEYLLDGQVKIIAEIEDWENDKANFNPHLVQVHLTITPEGVIEELITDAYNLNSEDTTLTVVGSMCKHWDDYVRFLEPWDNGDDD